MGQCLHAELVSWSLEVGVQTTSSSQDPDQGGSVRSLSPESLGSLPLSVCRIDGKIVGFEAGSTQIVHGFQASPIFVSSVLSRSIGGMSRVDVKWTGSVPARSTFGFS